MTISRLESGEHDPHLRTLWQIAENLSVPFHELLLSPGYFEDDDTVGEVTAAWESFDLLYGGARIEAKSSACVQRWEQNHYPE